MEHLDPPRREPRCLLRGQERLDVKLNGIDWVTDQDKIPTPWETKVKPRGVLPLTVRMRTKPEPHLKARAAGHTVVYRPTAEAPLACEG